MSSITLQMLLGTENVGASRTVINSNSTITANSINALKAYLDTDVAGGSLTVGNLEIPIGANAVGDTLFSLAGSGSVTGNFTIGGTLGVTSTTTWTGSSLFKNALVMDGSGASAVLTVGSAGQPVDLEHIEGLFVDTQFASSVPLNANVETDATAIFTPSAVSRVMYLDYTNFVAGGAAGAWKVSLPAGSKLGQKMYIRPTVIAAAMVGITATDGVLILNDNVHPDWQNYSAGATGAFQFRGAAEVDIQRQWVSLVWTSSGWQLENAHPSIFDVV